MVRKKLTAVGLVSCVTAGLLAGEGDRRIDPETDWMRAEPQYAQTLVLPTSEVTRRIAEEGNRESGGVYRFGVEVPVLLTPFTSGDSIDLGAERAWRLKIASPHAVSLHLQLDSFDLVPGARLYVISETSGAVLGPYTSRDENPDRLLGIPPLPGDTLTLVYFSPRSNELGGFRVTHVVHGYRDVLGASTWGNGAGGNASTCNIDINCPIAAQHQDVKRAVALLVLGGGACSGALLNNVQQDGAQLFLTAEHCFNAYPNTGGWSFVFNFEKPICSGIGGASKADTVSGATLLAKSGSTDYCLVRINPPIPPWFNVFFAGFDASGVAVSGVSEVHHPCGDVKKFSQDDSSPTKVVFQGMSTWYVADWASGFGEPGSSGSPFFDQQKRVVGQLWGGAAVCGGTHQSYHGRLEVSWGKGASSHIDPGGAGVLFVDGIEGSTVLSIDTAVTGVQAPATIEVGETFDLAFAIDSIGSFPPALPNWTAVLSADGVFDAADPVVATGTATALGAQLESIVIPFDVVPGAWNLIVQSPPHPLDANPLDNDSAPAPITISATTKPNLIASAISLPAQVEKGATLAAACVIDGNPFITGSFSYQIRLSADDNLTTTDPLLGTFTSSALGAQDVVVTIPASMPTGVFRMGLLVIAAEGEIFLADNTLLGGEVVVVAPPPPPPNVGVIAIVVPTKAKVGKKAKFEVTLAATQFAGPIGYQLRLSPDPEITTDDLLLKDLSAKVAGTAKKKVKIPAVGAGQWFVGVTVDGVVGELDFADNVFDGVPITIKN
jgi:hypothetical protein